MKKVVCSNDIRGTVTGILICAWHVHDSSFRWDAFLQGIILGCIGILLILITLIVWRKMEHKAPIHDIRQTGIDYCCWYNRVIILWCWHALAMVWENDCRNHHWYCRYTTVSFSYSSDKRYQKSEYSTKN